MVLLKTHSDFEMETMVGLMSHLYSLMEKMVEWMNHRTDSTLCS